MMIKKYVAITVLFLLFLITTAYADNVAEYKIEFYNYDSETKTYTANVYLNTNEYLSVGTFGIQYDAALSPVFELNDEYFTEFDNEYFKELHSSLNYGSNYIVFQWQLADNAPTTGEILLGTLTIENVVLENGIPSGWHTETIHQLDWFDTSLSKTPVFTLDADGICLNDEIFRYMDGIGYYQGYDMEDEDNPHWVNIGFSFNSGYELPVRTGTVISGIVYSYNPNNKVTATLYDSAGISIKSVEAVDTAAKEDGRVSSVYELDAEISEGEYILELKKDVHLTYTMNITVSNKNISVGEITLYCGDISGDGKIKLNDRSTLLKYLNMHSYTSDNETAIKSDLNGDGKVTLHDFNIMKMYYNKEYREVVSYA